MVTSSQNEKRFVTSTGVDTHWDLEETETTDDSPTLLQPTITCKKGAGYVQVVADDRAPFRVGPRCRR